jgi:exonuclease III
MCKTVTKLISVSSWNINGVYRKTCGTKANKIHDDEFQKIKKSYVIFLSETHTSYSDILLYDGYKSFMNCHSMDSSKKRGGIVVFIKRNILSGITLVDKSSSEKMWFN